MGIGSAILPVRDIVRNLCADEQHKQCIGYKDIQPRNLLTACIGQRNQHKAKQKNISFKLMKLQNGDSR